MNPFFTDYSEYLSRRFGNGKIQKLCVSIAATCPNRDGTIGCGGCIYCSNSAFSPAYCNAKKSVAEQIEAGKTFFARKYPSMRYLAYFQTFTSTHNTDAERIRNAVEEAASISGIAGIVLSTRPDCLPDSIISVLADAKVPVIVELGAETSHDTTLRLINRGHTFADTCSATHRLKDAGLDVGLHLIMGLPYETEQMMLETVDKTCALNIDILKFHHLQILRGTPLHKYYAANEIEVHPFDPQTYADLCVKIIGRVPTSIAIERFVAQSPPDMVVAPKWNIKNHEFADLLLKKLKREATPIKLFR